MVDTEPYSVGLRTLCGPSKIFEIEYPYPEALDEIPEVGRSLSRACLEQSLYNAADRCPDPIQRYLYINEILSEIDDALLGSTNDMEYQILYKNNGCLCTSPNKQIVVNNCPEIICIV